MQLFSRTRLFALAVAVMLGLPGEASSQDFDDVVIQVDNVRDNVYILTGAGGNIGLSIGEDGPLLIDDQFAPLTERIVTAVRSVSATPVRFVVNTHHHGDHTGGNANFDAAGALIVAHDNVRNRIQAAQATNDAVDPASLPVITFSDNATFHWNGQTTRIHHVDAAHTDGDAIVHFVEANVVHMGDTFFATSYPYIDLGSGGDIDGVIAAAEDVLARTDEETLIIPGHGPLSTPADLRDYRNMLSSIRASIVTAIDKGLTLDEIVASKPTSAFDERWGNGFINPDRFVTSVFNSLSPGS